MGKLLLPDFAMTKSLLPQANSTNLKCFKNSSMGALWYSNRSLFSYQQGISEPAAFNIRLKFYYNGLTIIMKFLSMLLKSQDGHDILNISFAKVNSADKDQRNYLIYSRTRSSILGADCYMTGMVVLFSISMLLLCEYVESNSFLFLFGLIFVLSFCAEPEKNGVNLRIILNN